MFYIIGYMLYEKSGSTLEPPPGHRSETIGWFRKMFTEGTDAGLSADEIADSIEKGFDLAKRQRGDIRQGQINACRRDKG